MKNKKDRSGIIYSTNPNFKPDDDAGESTASPERQQLKIYLDRLGGGKLVSRITGFVGDTASLEKLASDLRKKCGVGGGVRGGDILVQGDHRDRLLKILGDAGHQAKKAGG